MAAALGITLIKIDEGGLVTHIGMSTSLICAGVRTRQPAQAR
jgi:hypothetical protein